MSRAFTVRRDSRDHRTARHATRALVVTALIATGLAAAPQPFAAAAQTPAKQSTVNTNTAAASGATTTVSAADNAASAAAKSAGKPVLVDSDTTSTDQTTANPNGSFTLTRHVLPVRAKVRGNWAPVDATLTHNADGTVSPAAINGTLRFSGGGTAPLAALTDESGHALSLSWPGKLPAPMISGTTATYAQVLPGVDLTVTANTQGGFTDVLVVHDAAAAKNPALKNLRFATRTAGLKLATDPSGALTATDSKTGKTVFTAPPAGAWDSATTSSAGVSHARTMAADAPVASSVNRPGLGAHLSRMAVTARPGEIDVAPDAAVLAGSGIDFPLYLDPSVTPTPGTQAWTYVAQDFPDQAYMNSSFNDGHARVGYDGWGSPCPQTNIEGGCNQQTWSYFQLGPLNLKGEYIQDAWVSLTQTSASCTSCGPYTLYVEDTGGIGTGTTYRFPAHEYPQYTYSTPVQGNGTYEVHMQALVQNTVDNFTSQTIEVYEDRGSSDRNDYRYFANNPTLSIVYWSHPATPYRLSSTPALGEGLGNATSSCDTTSPGGWVNKTAGSNIQLSATTNTPDVGYPLWMQYSVGANGAAPSGGPATSNTYNAGSGDNTLRAGLNVADGSRYQYYATAHNPYVASGSSGSCYFRVDETPPNAPTITTEGNNKFFATATDPGPNPSGIAGFNYNLDGASISSPGEATLASRGVASSPLGRWVLWDGSGSTAADVNKTTPFTLQSGATWVGDNTRGIVLSTNGTTSGVATTSGPIVTTNADFSVSAWVKLAAQPTGWQTVLSQDGNVNSGFFLQYDSAHNAWAFSQDSADSANPAGIQAHAAVPPKAGDWYQLTGVYTHSSGLLQLYVNGALAGTATNTTAYNTTGSLVIGRSKYNGNVADLFNGKISDVQVYSRALSQSDVTAIFAGTSATISVPNATRWGTHSLWLQSIDNAGNVSTPQLYTWYDPAPTNPPPGQVGDIDGDGHSDLVAVDAAGDLRLYSNPLANSPNTGATSSVLDQKYGGATMIVAKSSNNWPYSSFAGALVAHAGSFTGNQKVDDLLIWQNGNLYIGQNTDNGLQAGWTFTGALTKPACAACANYNGTDWTSVRAMVALAPAAAGGRPSLLTLEEHNGVESLWLYPPQGSALLFSAPTLISTNTSSWDWAAQSLMSPGMSSGGGHTLWARDTLTGSLYQFTNIEAGITDPASASVQIGSGFTPSAYPILATDGDIQSSGHPDLYALSSAGASPAQTLYDFPGQALSGSSAFGSPSTLTTPGWGANIVALENNGAALNNVGVTTDGSTYTNANSFTGFGSTYSYTALTTKLTTGGATSGLFDSSGNSINGLLPDSLIQTGGGFTFNWPAQRANQPDNYAAAGQTIAAPTDQTVSGSQDTTLYLLGSATGNAQGVSGTAKLTWSDGTTQTVTVGFSDWVLGCGSSCTTQPPASSIIGTIQYRDNSNGSTTTNTCYLFEDTITLSPPSTGVQLASITLPTTASGENIHVFSTAAQ